MTQKLREAIEVKFGRRILYQKDCKALSDNIFNQISLVISPSTLRRLFGFLSTNSNPSRATLDILAQYAGYTDWESFTQTSIRDNEQEPLLTVWERAKAKAQEISQRNCISIKRENPLGESNTVSREFARERMDYFINSSHTATPIVGPGGFGKSTLLVNWYEERIASFNSGNNDIILFLPATFLENCLTAENEFDTWLFSLLGLSSSLVFGIIYSKPEIAPGKFILIIDALDEISLTNTKTEKIFIAIHKLVLKSSPKWFKLILSSRFSTWTEFISLGFPMDSWYLATKEYFSAEGTNIPALNEEEIQSILNRTINRTSTSKLIVEELSYEFIQTISYPYYLQLFIEIFKNCSLHLVVDKTDLLMEFIKKQIHGGQFADEKLDILSSIIRLSHADLRFGSIKKNDLKERFPIHLKLAGSYYSAYNQLISFGIISEELAENSVGIVTKKVKITQRALYRLLLVLSLIDKSNGIDFNLFQQIERDYANTPIKVHLINLLYEIAYKKRILAPLKEFFSLNEATLSKVFEFPNIHQILQRDDFMRRELVPLYASNSKAKRFLFQKFIDINTIANSSRLLIFNYLQHSESDEEYLYGKTLLYASNIYSLDFAWTKTFKDEFPSQRLSLQTPPLIAGLWFSCSLMDDYINSGKRDSFIIEQIENFSTECQRIWNEYSKSIFEIGLMLGLVNSKQYKVIKNRIERLLQNKTNENITSEEKALHIYLELANWHLTGKFHDSKIIYIQRYLSDTPSWISHQTTIVCKSLLSMYYFTLGNLNRAYAHLRKSLEISNMAGYSIYEVKLLNSLTVVLESIGEPEKASDCKLLAENLSKNISITLGSL